ncbi:MAG: hypothetical protein M3O15_01915, partial [Acidobacteriota bacterium]|nr:hypothetical protein [Acidobacteriota bacterium]
FLLHGLFALYAWSSWGLFARGGVIAWMDFPISLAYLGTGGGTLLAWSLLAGGAQWAGIAALLTLSLGRSARRPAGPRSTSGP